MKVALRSRTVWAYIASFSLLLVLNLLLGSHVGGHAQPAGGSQAQDSCPGERMGVQITGGEYQGRTVPEAVVNGEPWGGAYFEGGMRVVLALPSRGSDPGRLGGRGTRPETR